MKILGIETSGRTASVAILEDDVLLAEYTINNTLKHSETIMPMTQELLKRVNISVEDIELISVTDGPGSFTGLRIGSATAKGIAHSKDIPIASIPTTKVYASTIHEDNAIVHVLIDARSKEFYYASYRIKYKDNLFVLEELEEIKIVEIEEIIKKLQQNESIKMEYIVGDAVTLFEKEIEELKKDYIITKPIYSSLSAKNVALLGYEDFKNGKTLTAYTQKPYYYKKTQAEKDLERK